jgi:hypothetical protein
VFDHDPHGPGSFDLQAVNRFLIQTGLPFAMAVSARLGASQEGIVNARWVLLGVVARRAGHELALPDYIG